MLILSKGVLDVSLITKGAFNFFRQNLTFWQISQDLMQFSTDLTKLDPMYFILILTVTFTLRSKLFFPQWYWCKIIEFSSSFGIETIVLTNF